MTEPEIEPWPVYEARLRAEQEAAHHMLVVDGPIPKYVGPFPTVDAAFAWNETHRGGADARVVPLHAPWLPWREPPRPVEVEHEIVSWTPEMAACLRCTVRHDGPHPCEQHR